MVLSIVQYGHPALRSKGRRIEQIDDRIRQLAADMIETMRAADGVGLAAQQVGLPQLLCVIDVSESDYPGSMRIDGTEVSLEDHMPLVLINPSVERRGETLAASEGCLSFPGIMGRIPRPTEVKVTATLLSGEEIVFEADGLLARAVQHEHDHLEGILFIDKMVAEDRAEIAAEVDKLMRRNAVI